MTRGRRFEPVITDAQRALMVHLLTDLTFAQIAAKLGKTECAVDGLRRRLYANLDVHTRHAACVKWIRQHREGA